MATIDLSGLVRPQLVEATKREDTPNLAEFRLQPLERGFGHTLGNAMRRLLLSSLRGSAVWAFRIDGVVHEHQTIGGVVEDVHQIIGNLKTLTLALPDDVEQTVLRIVKSGPGAVTAADIQVSGGARVIDPTHHLFTITDERDFNVELHVNKGRGYIESDQHPADKNLSVDVVRIDAIYSPVRRVNFAVSETRVGQRTDFDKLTLEVVTNGSLTPEDAVAYAAKVLKEQLQVFINFTEEDEPSSHDEPKTQESFNEALFKRVDELDLSVRSANCLQNAGVEYIWQLVERSEAEMLKTKNFGRKSLNEIKELLSELGLSLGMKLNNFPKNRA